VKKIYDTDFIVEHLPQKIPFLMIDRVIEYKPNRRIKTLKNVTVNEDYFQGHFPKKKIMPGVMTCEALSQTVTLFNILNCNTNEKNTGIEVPQENGPKERQPLLASINIKFIDIVTPGDQLILQARPGKKIESISSWDVEALVDGKVVTKGTLFSSVNRLER